MMVILPRIRDAFDPVWILAAVLLALRFLFYNLLQFVILVIGHWKTKREIKNIVVTRAHSLALNDTVLSDQSCKHMKHVLLPYLILYTICYCLRNPQLPYRQGSCRPCGSCRCRRQSALASLSARPPCLAAGHT